MAKQQKLYYLGRRDNPQLPKPYYVAYGQLSKAEAKRKGKALYGSMTLEPFESGIAYACRIAELDAAGFTVNKGAPNYG